MRAPGALVVILATAGALAGCHGRSAPETVGPAGPVATGYVWDLPPGFPVPRVPEGNPMTSEKVELGRHLFHDTRLSGTGTHACASCHRQEAGFTDGRARAVGESGELHPRSAMSLANVAYNATLTWADPRLVRLEDQARVPMFGEHPVELGLLGREDEVLDRLRSDPLYVELFGSAFPDSHDPFSMSNVVRAVASFERTLVSGDSPYNRLVYRGETDALSDSARRGMRLFFSDRLRCSECHSGFNFSGPVRFENDEPAEATFHNTGLYDLDGEGAYPTGNRGLHEITGRPEDMGAFRAPTLFNVAVTAPYMHDGSVATLREVVDLYAAGGRVIESGLDAGDGRANPYKSERMTGFTITDGEREDLLAFLESLTDEAFLRDPRFANPFSEEDRVDAVAGVTPSRDRGRPTTPARP